MKLLFAAAALAAATLPTLATPVVRQVIYNVDAASSCSAAANDRAELRQGLGWCNTALSDPLMNQRAALLMDRGVIKVKLGDNAGALDDYNAAIAMDAQLGDAYVSRAGVEIAMRNYDLARADIAQGMALHATNMHAAYFSRAVIEEESGNIRAAYGDYRQALALKPDFWPASRELARFKVVTRTARS